MADDTSQTTSVLEELQNSVDGASKSHKLSEEDFRKLHELVRQAEGIVEEWKRRHPEGVKQDAPVVEVNPQTTQPATIPAIDVEKRTQEIIDDAYLL